MTEDPFLKKLSAILEVDATLLNEQFKLDYANWDSLTVMATIAAIDEHFDVSVGPKQLAACSSIRDLLALISTGQPNVT